MDHSEPSLTAELLMPTLADIVPNAGCAFGPGFMQRRKDVAAKIGVVIGLFADIEFQQGRLLHRLLGTDADTAFTIYNKLRGLPQKEIMQEFAKKTLDATPFSTLKQVSKAVEMRGNERNKLAHWLWGISEELPDALLLIQPANWFRAMAYAIDTPIIDPTDHRMRLDSADILVYDLAGMDRITTRMEETHKLLYQFVSILHQDDPEEVAQRCHQLSTQWRLPTSRARSTRDHN